MHEVYKAFRFEKIDIKLATRPSADKRLGSDESWDKSERALSDGLERAGLAYESAPGEGAFYGPKIEFHVQDALKRSWQLGTIQYDPNLPERFGLSYVGEDGKEHRPVMLHRAIFGSLERFFGVYLEHCGGQLSRLARAQAGDRPHGEREERRLCPPGRRAPPRPGSARRGRLLERQARAPRSGAPGRARYPYMLVVGPKEAETDSVGVRSRDAGELGAMKVDELAARLVAEASPPGRSAGPS